MDPQWHANRWRGFSLVELLIAVMILGIGLAMIAGAFPVGLAFHEQSVDETIAGLLARTAISRVTLLRTNDNRTEPAPAGGDLDWGGQERMDRGYRDFWGHLGVVECFEETGDLQWLFDAGQHAGGILTQQALGADIDTWLRKAERVYDVDNSYGFQIFYHRVADPGTGGAASSVTYVAYAVVQKATPGAAGSTAWDRLPTPRRRSVQSVSTTDNSIKLDSGAATVGAIVGTVENAVWNRVRDVDSAGNLYMIEPVGGLAGKHVWVIDNAIDVYAGVVNRQRVRGGG